MTEQKTSLPTSKGKAEWINELVASGFALMPLYQGTKVPVHECWTDIPPDPTQGPADFPFNYGVIPDDSKVIIDADPRGFKDGIDSFQKLMTDIGITDFDTYTVLSGRGDDGMHIYLNKPLGVKLRTKNVDYPGIEIKTVGSFLVGAGSIHPISGKEYRVVRGTPDKLADIPTALMELYIKTDRTLVGALDAPKDDEATRKRFRAFLFETPVAVWGEDGDPTTYYTACKGKTMGLSPQVTFEEMRDHWNERCSPPWEMGELAKKVNNAYDYSRSGLGSDHPEADFKGFETDPGKLEGHQAVRWALDSHGKLKPNITNILYMLDNVPAFTKDPNPLYKLVRYNLFTNRIEFTRPAFWHPKDEKRVNWGDDDNSHVQAWLSETKYVDYTLSTIQNAVIVAAQREHYHPVKDYLNGLKWDGIPRVERLFIDYAGTEDNIYYRCAARMFMAAGAGRILEPGCKYDTIVTLEGEPGRGKSTFCRTLAVKDEWYADIYLEPRNKDTIVVMQGKWMCEVSEMICAKKSDAEDLKSFISKQTDVVRLPYGRNPENLPRESVFIGTHNPSGDNTYYKDQTGNRRHVPITIGEINIPHLTRDLDQLWAEAVVLFKAGEPLEMVNPKAIAYAKRAQEDRREKDVWEITIPEWLARQPVHHKYLATTQILEDVLNIPMRQVDKQVYTRVSLVMKALGWTKGLVGPTNSRKQGYKNPVQTPEEDLLADL
jgi:predicted P-loop ATPase